MSWLMGPTMHHLEQGLNITLHRQNVLSSNLANLDTPGFTPRDVDFEAAMQHALGPDSPHGQLRVARSDARHIGSAQETAGAAMPSYDRPDREPGLNGNSVDLDMQMARLAQNSTLYAASTRTISKKLALLKYAVSEGAV